MFQDCRVKITFQVLPIFVVFRWRGDPVVRVLFVHIGEGGGVWTTRDYVVFASCCAKHYSLLHVCCAGGICV